MSSLICYSDSAPNLYLFRSVCRWRMWLTCWEWPRRRPWASFSRSGESSPISSTSLKPKHWMFAWNNMRRRPRSRSSLKYLKRSQLYWRGRAEHECVSADGSRKIGNVGVGVNFVCVTVCKQRKSTQTSHPWRLKSQEQIRPLVYVLLNDSMVMAIFPPASASIQTLWRPFTVQIYNDDLHFFWPHCHFSVRLWPSHKMGQLSFINITSI
jgi:hypothetical protein